MRELNIEEREATKGALGNVGLGAVAGALWNGYQYFAGSHTKTFGGALVAIGSGAIGGAVAGSGLGLGGAFYGGGFAAVGSMAAPLVAQPQANGV